MPGVYARMCLGGVSKVQNRQATGSGCMRDVCDEGVLREVRHLADSCRLVADSLGLSSLIVNSACGTNFALRAHCGHMYQRPPRGEGGRKHQATHADAATQQDNLFLRCLKSLVLQLQIQIATM